MTNDTGYDLKNSTLGPDITLAEMGRECLAQCISKRYCIPFKKVYDKIKNMTSLERDEYLDQLKMDR